VPIKNIVEWPGNGDTTLGQTWELAPYFDVDDDGSYDALRGDFPLIKGDQAIFFIYNDHRGAHHNSGSEKMGIEVHALFYAFDHPDDSALFSTVFADYKVFNRSENFYSDIYTAGYLDYDLGFAFDDFIGCDSLLDAVYVYNGFEMDGSGVAGEYGLHPPAQGLTCLNFDMNGFINFQSYAASPTSDPYSPAEYYNYMKNIWRDLTHLTYGGNGYGGEVETDFAFSGNPHTGEGWTEPGVGSEPGDRRGIFSSGPYSFNPGDMLEFEVALVFARDYLGNNLSSVGLMEERIAELMLDEDVTRKAGIYPYVLDGKERSLSLRAFSEKVKREAYTKQGGICADGACPEKSRVFNLVEMEADHLDPWHAGGRSVLSNCRMLCKSCNRRKGGV
jgi:hypothetical protein